MRWFVCCLMLPLSAGAASVLLVPVDERAQKLADELVEPFGAEKLTVKMAGPGSPAVSCLKSEDRNACLGAIEEKAKVVGVFIVSGALQGAKGSVTLELLSKGVVVKKDTTKVLKGRIKTQLRGPIANLLKLLPKSQPAPVVEAPKVTITETPKDPEPVDEPVKVADAPKKTAPTVLTPERPRDDLSLKEKPVKAERSKLAAWVVTGLAVAAAGTAAAVGGVGLAGKGRLEAAPGGVSALSYSEASALQQSSNAQLSAALGLGIGAGVTGVVAAILWGAE